MKPETRPPFNAVSILIGGVAVALFGAIGISVVLFILIVVGETIEHFTPQPTPDQLYGCTIQQQAPNGDCP